MLLDPLAQVAYELYARDSDDSYGRSINYNWG